MRKLLLLLPALAGLTLAAGAPPAAAATQDLCSGGDALAAYDIFYDTTNQSIDLDAAGSASSMVLTVTVIASGAQASVDVTPYLNQGTVVLIGPGSVLGITRKVSQSQLPVVQKGQAYPYTCDADIQH